MQCVQQWLIESVKIVSRTLVTAISALLRQRLSPFSKVFVYEDESNKIIC